MRLHFIYCGVYCFNQARRLIVIIQTIILWRVQLNVCNRPSRTPCSQFEKPLIKTSSLSDLRNRKPVSHIAWAQCSDMIYNCLSTIDRALHFQTQHFLCVHIRLARLCQMWKLINFNWLALFVCSVQCLTRTFANINYVELKSNFII